MVNTLKYVLNLLLRQWVHYLFDTDKILKNEQEIRQVHGASWNDTYIAIGI